MNLCAGLAEAILHVHSLSLVHKNVRPENILLVPGDQESAAKLFLSGWPFARETQDSRCRQIGEVLLERRIYQHPPDIGKLRSKTIAWATTYIVSGFVCSRS